METMFTSIPPSEITTNKGQAAWRLISVLLQYPSEDWLQLDELQGALAEIGAVAATEPILRFIDEVKHFTLDDLSELYVNTFDFNAKTSLYLTYSELGEEKERGEKLVQLKAIYETVGMEADETELPDYLPMFLEFLSLAPTELARNLLQQYRPAIEQLAAELRSIDSPYWRLMEACLMAAAELPCAETQEEVER